MVCKLKWYMDYSSKLESLMDDRSELVTHDGSVNHFPGPRCINSKMFTSMKPSIMRPIHENILEQTLHDAACPFALPLCISSRGLPSSHSPKYASQAFKNPSNAPTIAIPTILE